MDVFAVLATGPSLTANQVEKVRGLRVIAVSDAWRLAPWAEVLVSADKAWWNFHRPDFAGRRVSALKFPGMDTEQIEGVVMGSNSGLLALHVAVSMGAKRILLLGYDLGGTHFFGPHPEGLKNTKPHRFEEFKRQFAGFRPKGVEIVNCTPGSALACYPQQTLKEALLWQPTS
jgi:hypothetical protein